MDPEYVTGQINSHVLEIFVDDFALWFLQNQNGKS